ncbi:MAG: hypothetical protein ABIP55_05905 [Tepidisphaeraceae bacterium]
MRTTIRMKPELARRAKEEAAKSGRTFTELVETALSEHLARRSSATRTRKIKLPVSKTRGRPLTMGQVQAAIEQANLEYDLKKVGMPVR